MGYAQHALAACLMAVVAVAAGCGQDPSVQVPGTPDGTVETVSASLADGQPGVLWNALPASYQSDVNELIEAFADSVDAEVYNKSFALIAQLGNVLSAKKEFILNSEVLRMGAPVDLAEIGDEWDTLVAMVNAVTTSELRSVESLRQLDVGRFLSTTGATVMRHGLRLGELSGEEDFQYIARLKEIKTEVLSSEEDRAVVRVTLPDGETDEVELSRVDGKWLPTEVVEGWDEGVAEMRQMIAEMNSSEYRMQFMMGLSMFETVLTALERAGGQDEFDSAVMQVLAMGF